MSGFTFIDNKKVSFLESEAELEDSLFEIKWNFNRLLKENQNLKKENAELKSEQYKDSELLKLQEENKKLNKYISRGFPIYDDEQKMIDKWRQGHSEKEHCGNAFDFYYQFESYGIGDFGSCICFDCQRKAKLSPNYKHYMEKHNGELLFKSGT